LTSMTGRVAIVSGGTKLSGASIASKLAGLGAAVVICGRSVDDGEAVAHRIGDSGGEARFVRTDLMVEADVMAAVEFAERLLGRLDVVVNNASAIDAVRAGEDVAVVDARTETVEKILRVGLLAPLWFFKYGIPVMLKTGGGSFVSVSSSSAVGAYAGVPAYSASKAALEALSRQVCADYGHAGIRSNVVRLGAMRVPGNDQIHGDAEFASASLRLTMVARLGAPSDLAEAVAFLASDASGYVNASVLPLDGGTDSFRAQPSVSATWRRQREDR
jgi:3alpha(or 20beta)-hydroxysteroid dehydrogenase